MSVIRECRYRLRRLTDDESGQAATEYILIIGLVTLPIVMAYNAMQNAIKDFLDRIAKLFRGPGI